MPAQQEAVPIFPFFVGAPRSGTTLIRAIFDFHPELAVPDESNFVPMLGRMRGRYEQPPGFAVTTFVDDVLQHRSFRRWAMSRDYLLDAFDARPPVDYSDAIRALFALYARRQGKVRYADKTPRNLMNIPLLAQLFPEARFIHIIRDGRDVALSVLDVDFGAQEVGAAALSWKEFVTEGRGAGQRLGSRYYEIRYEDILENPERAVLPLCEFIDLPFDSAMLRYFERSQQITAPAAWSRRHVLLPPTKGLRNWRTQMAQKDVATYEALAGDLLEELGYERTVHKTPGPVLLHARISVLGRRLRGLGRKARKSMTSRKTGPAPRPAPLLSQPGSDRKEMFSFLLAHEAAKDPEVTSFRGDILGDRLLSLDHSPAWIAEQAQKDGAGRPDQTLEYLGGSASPLRQPTNEGGVLERLGLLSSKLAEMYGWDRSQASTFVLTGLSPIASNIRTTTVGGVPLSSTSRIVLEVNPAVTPRQLSKHYKRARARVTQGKSDDTTNKQRKLAVFVAERTDGDWSELMKSWNEEFPKWCYQDAKSFQREAVSSRRLMLDPY
ncbi:MAG: sulfotransferase [Actinobacteria bacterium]|nr:sulfotransferase [Actinomycetota bacterium]